MTFKEAKDELKRIASGKYHTITYGLTEYASDCGAEQVVECHIYIDGEGSTTAPTFADAFEKRRTGRDHLLQDMPDITDLEVAA